MLVPLRIKYNVFEESLGFKQSLIRMVHLPETVSLPHSAYSSIVLRSNGDEVAKPKFSLLALNSGPHFCVVRAVARMLDETSEECVFQEAGHESHGNLFRSRPPLVMFVLIDILSF
ncbi:hypothetical protein FSOLCH5_014507 [Fusarium solani]